jgi:hypothetical protein
VYKRVFRFLLIVILVFGLAQFAANLISFGPSRASAASDPVIAAAGDIACDPVDGSFNNGNGTSSLCRQLATSDVLVNGGFDAVLALGDNQYECGSSQAFLGSYDLSWGKVKSITHPAAGNHEYQTSGATDCDATNAGAAGYYSYFGAAAGAPGQGYYSFDIGAWHLISLNTQCSQVGGCGTSSPQYLWLQSDLAAHPNQCLLAYWHIPLFSSYPNAAPNSQPFWNLLYSAHADLILNGHSHTYERFGQQNPSGGADPNGIRQIIVGTGGKSHYSITSTAANSEVWNTSTYGVLKLSLHSNSYDWQFMPIAGQTFTDSGSNSCHFTGLVPTYTPTDTSTPASTGTLAQTDTFTSTTTSTGTLAATDTFTLTPTGGVTNTATPTQAPSFTPTASGGNQIVATPAADAYVDSANPANNYGTGTTIRVDASPVVNTYIRFNVSGVSGTVTHASLSLYANSNGTQGIRVYSVTDNTWGEMSLTYNNAPPLGNLLASTGPFAAGTRVTLDLSGYITGNGTYSFAVTDLSSTAISLASRESGANAPQLILSLGSGSSPTPTNTPIPSNTPTITPTFTAATSPTNTPANTDTFTPTSELSITPTNTLTSTYTSSPTSGITITPTNTATGTDNPTATQGSTFTPTNAATGTNTSTNTATRTNTPTPKTANSSTPTNTPTRTNTSTPTPGVSPTPTYTPTSTATSSSQVHTFTPAADAYVDASRPTANFGTGTYIQVDGSPINNGYIKFNVAGLSGTITKVTLRLYANSSASSGIKAIRVADSTWGETTITYNNAPSLGGVLATSAAFSSKTWITLDVTGYITGNGTYSFGIINSSTRAVRLASRESGVNAAQLIIETH